MAVFSVLEPPPRAKESAAAPDRFVFLRDRYNWAAFFFGALWMIWHRLWLVLLGYVVVIAALEGVFRVTGTSSIARLTAELLLAVLVALEASSLRRWTLLRRGWRECGVIVADDREMAERRFFATWTGETTSVPQRVPTGTAATPANKGATAAIPPILPSTRLGVVGLFPQPGGNR